jgi:hypothetical protein
MRIVAYQVTTPCGTTGYGLSQLEAVEHLSGKLGRKPRRSECFFAPIVTDPEPQSLEILRVQNYFAR